MQLQLSDKQSERKVLSAAVNSEQACVEMIYQLSTDDFTEALHKELFDLIIAIYTDGTFPNLGIIYKEAIKYELMQTVKKQEEIKAVLTDWEHTDDIQFWIDEIISASKARQLHSVLNRCLSTLKDKGRQDIDNTLSTAISDISNIDLGRGKDDIEDGPQIARQLKEFIDGKVKQYQELSATGEIVLEGLSTGFGRLDFLTLGYKPGDLIMVAAQTGHGKTALALQTAKNVAVDQRKPLLYINTEMSNIQVYQRLCGIIAEVPIYQIKQGNLSSGEQIKIDSAIKVIQKAPFYHKIEPHLTPSRCVVLGKKARVQNKIEMIIVDYIGRMDKLDSKLQEWQVLEQIAKSMKLLAQDLQIPIMVLAQLSQEGTLQGTQRMKNECDLLLLMAPLKPEEKKEKYDQKYVDANYRLYVAKNRDGEADKNIALRYDKSVQQICSAKNKPDKWAGLGRYVGEEDY